MKIRPCCVVEVGGGWGAGGDFAFAGVSPWMDIGLDRKISADFGSGRITGGCCLVAGGGA
jgi:hypothetical protein